MNRYEIRDILNAHKEHFRVLPVGAALDLQGIIDAIDADVDAAIQSAASQKAVKPKPVKKESPAKSFTTGKVAKKKATKKGK